MLELEQTIIGETTKSTCYIANLLEVIHFCNVTILEKKEQTGRKERRKEKEIFVRKKKRFPSEKRNKRNSD